VDNVEFMAATNPGEPLKPLVKIASTGELSRFMLAIKGALASADNTPVLIFDEIDIGVGGRSGEIIGRKLWLLSRGRQVLCVTHLPQIAAFAEAHYRIQKGVYGVKTASTLEVLEDKTRIEELAAMLSGVQYTDTSLQNVREMLDKAIMWQRDKSNTNA
jgi:DNA repair protein RecN (Recombination protein N)